MTTYSDPTNLTSTPEPLKEALRPGTFIVLAAGIVAVLSAGFFYWQIMNTNNQVTTTATQIDQAKTKVAQLQPAADELNQYVALAKNLHALFDTQTKWEDVLATIEKHLYKKIAVTGLQINDENTLVLTGTIDNYQDYAILYATLTDPNVKPYFATVKPVNVSAQATKDGKATEGLSFTFSITLGPQALKSTASSQ